MATHLHQVLLQNWKNSIRNTQNTQNIFGDDAHGKKTQTLLSDFLNNSMGKLQLKSTSILVDPWPTGWTKENMKNIHKIINENVWSILSKLTGILGLLLGTFQQILRHDLNMHWILEGSVHWLLTTKQKWQYVSEGQ